MAERTVKNITYQDFTKDVPVTLKKDKRDLLKMMAQFGSEGRAEYNRLRNEGKQQRAALDSGETFDATFAPLHNQADALAQGTHMNELGRMKTAHEYYLDQVAKSSGAVGELVAGELNSRITMEEQAAERQRKLMEQEAAQRAAEAERDRQFRAQQAARDRALQLEMLRRQQAAQAAAEARARSARSAAAADRNGNGIPDAQEASAGIAESDLAKVNEDRNEFARRLMDINKERYGGEADNDGSSRGRAIPISPNDARLAVMSTNMGSFGGSAVLSAIEQTAPGGYVMIGGKWYRVEEDTALVNPNAGHSFS